MLWRMPFSTAPNMCDVTLKQALPGVCWHLAPKQYPFQCREAEKRSAGFLIKHTRTCDINGSETIYDRIHDILRNTLEFVVLKVESLEGVEVHKYHSRQHLDPATFPFYSATFIFILFSYSLKAASYSAHINTFLQCSLNVTLNRTFKYVTQL